MMVESLLQVHNFWNISFTFWFLIFVETKWVFKRFYQSLLDEHHKLLKSFRLGLDLSRIRILALKIFRKVRVPFQIEKYINELTKAILPFSILIDLLDTINFFEKGHE